MAEVRDNIPSLDRIIKNQIVIGVMKNKHFIKIECVIKH